MDGAAIDSGPLISVVTPSFNHGRFIADAVESVLGQGEPRIEHIVVDAASTDDTAAVLSRYSHLTVISEPDRGQSHALNKGIAAARAPIVCWLNADDFLLDRAFETALSLFAAATEPLAVVGHYYVVDDAGEFRRSMRTPPFDAAINRHYGVVVPTSGAFYSRRVFDEGGVRLDEGYDVVMDWDLYQQLAERGIPIRHTGTFLSAFRVHDRNKSIAGPHTSPEAASIIASRRKAERDRFHAAYGSAVRPAVVRGAVVKTLFHWNHVRLAARKAIRGYYRANRRDAHRPPVVAPARLASTS